MCLLCGDAEKEEPSSTMVVLQLFAQTTQPTVPWPGLAIKTWKRRAMPSMLLFSSQDHRQINRIYTHHHLSNWWWAQNFLSNKTFTLGNYFARRCSFVYVLEADYLPYWVRGMKINKQLGCHIKASNLVIKLTCRVHQHWIRLLLNSKFNL